MFLSLSLSLSLLWGPYWGLIGLLLDYYWALIGVLYRSGTVAKINGGHRSATEAPGVPRRLGNVSGGLEDMVFLDFNKKKNQIEHKPRVEGQGLRPKGVDRAAVVSLATISTLGTHFYLLFYLLCISRHLFCLFFLNFCHFGFGRWWRFALAKCGRNRSFLFKSFFFSSGREQE